MRIIECDRCHKRIKGVEKTGFIGLDYQNIKTGDLDGNNEFDGWDLCEDCMQKIRDFVRNISEKPKAQIKRVPKAEGTMITRADWIRRLAGEGKTVKEICEITKASEPTVRKYKAEVVGVETTSEPDTEGDTED